MARTPTVPRAAEPASQRATEDIIPGRLRVRVYLGEIPGPRTGTCWTYVTDGFVGIGRPEFVLSIRRAPDEATFPRDPFDLFKLVYQSAAPGNELDEWTLADFHGEFLGRADLTGVLVVPAEAPAGITLPDRVLGMIVVTADEVEVANALAVARVTSMLGQRDRYFPMPFWLDRDRQSVVKPKDLEGSVFGKLPHVFVHQLSVHIELGGTPSKTSNDDGSGLASWTDAEAGRVHLRVTKESSRQLAGLLKKGVPFLAVVAPEEDAGSRLVWVPGSTDMHAITGPVPSRTVTGNFVVFAPIGPEHGAFATEDGFAIFLREADWKALETALASGQALSIEGEGGPSAWSLDWAGPRERPAASDTGSAALFSIDLLTDEHDLARRTNVQDLATFLKAAEAAVQEVVGAAAFADGELIVEVEVSADGRIRATLSPDGSAPWRDEVKQRLEQLMPPPVSEGSVRVRLHFTLHAPGSRPVE